jgi:hypothetical protein
MRFSASRSELDSMIAGIELTLVSIIQGVALTVLIESAHQIIADLETVFWPYVLGGLLIIFVFWSRAVLHIITLIRWPLEFGHNFLYIGCALLEAVVLSQLSVPEKWFGFGAAFIAVGWLLFVYDLRLIHARMRDSAGDAGNRLYAQVRRDQWLNIGFLLPAVFLLNLICAFCIHFWREFFIARHGHLVLIAIQIIGFAGYLIYVVRFYLSLAPLVVEARHEWRQHSGDSSLPGAP